MDSIKHRILSLQNKIEEAATSVGRSPNSITLIAASKAQSIEAIQAAHQHGILHFGENYVQEFMGKWDKIARWESRPSFHFIGHLQSNKVKFIIDKVDTIQTVDSLKLFQKIVKEAGKHQRPMNVLIQVNSGQESSKSGISPNDLSSFVGSIPVDDLVKIQGLMAIPPYEKDPEKSRPYFQEMKSLLDQCKAKFPQHPLKELSMGMTHDFRVAIEEGATQIRIGTGIFGSRTSDQR